MRHSRWISSILLLSLTSTQVVVADDRSLHDSSHLGDSISGYIEQYNQMMSSQIQPPAPGESAADWKKKWEASRAGQILKMVLDGDIERLSQNISSLGNNDTFADQHARLLVGLVRDVSRQNPETYDEAVSMLLADYYESPSRRDAIYELLAATSSQLKSTGAMAASDPNRYLTAAADGTMTAWTLLTLWNWRGGAKGLARDGKTIYSNLGRGLRWMSQSLKTRIRPGSASMNSMVAVQDWVGSTAAQLPILVSNARLGAQGQTIQKELAVIIEQQRAAETGKAAEKISKTYLQKLAIYMRNLGLSAVVGGGSYALAEWNLSTASMKLDPMLPLELIQAYSIVSLESKTLGLKKLLAKRTTEAAIDQWLNTYLQNPAIAEQELKQLVWQLNSLKVEYSHLAQTAKQFKANIPLPQAGVIPASYAGNVDERASVQSFLQKSRALRAFVTRMNTSASSSVSLSPIEAHLADMDQLIEGMSQQLLQIKQMQKEELTEIKQGLK